MRIATDRFMETNRDMEGENYNAPPRESYFTTDHLSEANELFGLTISDTAEFRHAIDRFGARYGF